MRETQGTEKMNNKTGSPWESIYGARTACPAVLALPSLIYNKYGVGSTPPSAKI